MKKIWPYLSYMVRRVYAKAEVETYQNKEGKPVLRVTVDNMYTIYLSTEVGLQVGAAAKEAAELWQKEYVK